MRWAKKVFGRCFELVVQRRGRSTEAHVALTKDPPWEELSDCEKHARLRERVAQALSRPLSRARYTTATQPRSADARRIPAPTRLPAMP